MRRFLVRMVVAAVAALVPLWAVAGNQEVAEQIANGLKSSGKLHGYRIGVKYQDGTAWLKGEVSSREQMSTALQLASQAPGVSRVVNNLSIISQDAAREPALHQPRSAAEPSAEQVRQAVETLRGPSASMAAQPAARNTQSLQPIQGALAAEQFPRSVARDMRTSPTQVAQPVAVAERVPTTFAASPARPVNAMDLQEPTLAPPRPSGLVAMQPAAPEPAAPRPVQAAPAQVPAQPGAPLPLAQTGAPLPLPAAGQPTPAQGALPAGASAVRYDQPNLPNYSWPGYAAYPNYAAVTYPKQYSPTAWPYIGPFYPYPQVPLGWRKVTLEWHDGWWNLDFDDGSAKGPFSGLFRPCKRH